MTFMSVLKGWASTGGTILGFGVAMHLSTLLNTDWSTGYGGMNTLWGFIINLIEIGGLLVVLASPIAAVIGGAIGAVTRRDA